MRLKIQSPQQQPPGPDSSASAVGPGTLPPNLSPDTRPARPASRLERLLAIVTGWAVATPVALCSIALLVWSLAFRLPDPHKFLSAQARALPQRPIGETRATPEALAELRQQMRERSRELCQKPDELGPLLSRLEASARQLGWRVEASIQPAVSQPGGLKELTLHPVIIQLEDTAEPAAPAYARLIEWLRTASSLPRRVEVVSLQLRSAGSGLRKAQIELHLFSLNSSEEVSPK